MAVWIDDGSGWIQPGSEACAHLFTTSSEHKTGTPANALYDRPLMSGDFFNVRVCELGTPSAFVGLATKTSFQQGWGMSALLFGKNLSSGSALVRAGFGEEVKVRQKIGVLVEIEDDTVSVTFWQDDRCLGLAFEAKRSSQDPIYPVVSAFSPGDSFDIAFPETAPRCRIREALPTSSPAEGQWMMADLKIGADLASLPLAEKMGDGEVGLQIKCIGNDTFRLACHVANTLNTTAKVTDDEDVAPAQKVEIGPIAATRKMSRQGVMEVEREVAQALRKVVKWTAVEESSLTLEGPDVCMEFVPKWENTGMPPATDMVL